MSRAATRPGAPDLRFEAVGRQWGERVALAELDLEIRGGSRVAVIGPSGSGKTTLLRLAGGALRPTSGRVLAGGVDIASMSPGALRDHRRRCGLVDQGALLISQLSVHRNVLAGMIPGWPWYRVLASMAYPLERDRVGQILGAVGLDDRQWDRADTLSGGQKQRVAIARAIAGEPDVVFADEPTAALDPTTAREVIDLLVAQVGRRAATLLVSTHRISQVAAVVDRVIGLREGRLFFDLPSEQVDDAALDALYEGSAERA